MNGVSTKIFPALNNSRIDQISLECANSRVPMNLIGMLKDKEVLVGAIDVASSVVETPEQAAETLREAMKYIDAEPIIACTNCGLAPLAMDVSRAKIVALGSGAQLLRDELA
ncbi:MAG: 5-methyltetrahydropteroyltriglutamate--homocysteine methyltransferase [Paracoccaceae bacterium]|jgi:5-methyltetrahydropteroyltriglutamate--homocysteine methyltransferase